MEKWSPRDVIAREDAGTCDENEVRSRHSEHEHAEVRAFYEARPYNPGLHRVDFVESESLIECLFGHESLSNG